jgi:hypothetical protein
MGERQYAPGLGRFLSVDPVEGGCANDYAYVKGDPIGSNDLSGRGIGEFLCRPFKKLKPREKLAAVFGTVMLEALGAPMVAAEVTVKGIVAVLGPAFTGVALGLVGAVELAALGVVVGVLVC